MALFSPEIPKNLGFKILKHYKACVPVTFLQMRPVGTWSQWWSWENLGSDGLRWAHSPVYDLLGRETLDSLPTSGPFQGFN